MDPTMGLNKVLNEYKDARRVGVAMLIALGGGGFFVAMAANGGSSTYEALLWAAACSAVGWFLGFLFGIPRALSSDTARTGVTGRPAGSKSAEQPAAGQPQSDKGASEQDPTKKIDSTKNEANIPAGDASISKLPQGPSTAVNTNLEQISDWLTKIIVGVSLVEIRPAIDRLNKAAEVIAGSLNAGGHTSFAYAIMIYFSVSGFLGSYLLTRLFLQRAFSNVDNDPCSNP